MKNRCISPLSQTSGQSNLTERPHRCRTWTVQSYSPVSTNVHPYLIHASLDPLESITQTASQSVQPFLESWRHRVPILYNGPLIFPVKIVPLQGDLDPNLIYGSLSPPESTTQMESGSIQPFLQGVRSWQTDWQTDHAIPYVTGRIYIRSTVMQLNNNNSLADRQHVWGLQKALQIHSSSSSTVI